MRTTCVEAPVLRGEIEKEGEGRRNVGQASKCKANREAAREDRRDRLPVRHHDGFQSASESREEARVSASR